VRIPQALNLRRMAAAADASRRQTLDAVHAVLAHLGAGAQELLTDAAKLRTLVLAAVVLALGVFVAREAARTAARVLRRYLGHPALVRASPREWPLGSEPWFRTR
jgi:predicted transporter